MDAAEFENRVALRVLPFLRRLVLLLGVCENQMDEITYDGRESVFCGY